ncbi:sugar diacid recognition domain-containing protein [Vibrio coralliilyticus]|uniref:sugar diacid recognition domain-containing protein n=1 Tax=Vibrio coralliilyticus TaxID=190893 RepID=UPI002FD10569
MLDAQLAQRIVDRTMPIIGYNINVMNNAGLVVASGESSRIGQTHDGALLALSRKASVEVTSEDCKLLSGVKPGVNLLLKHKNAILGVVGITGEPNEIRGVAELVAMTAELIIDQADLLEKVQRDRRYRDEFILACLTGRLSSSEMRDGAEQISVNPSDSWELLLVEMPTQDSSTATLTERLYQKLGHHLCAHLSARHLVIFVPTEQPLSADSVNEWLHWLEQTPCRNLKVSTGKFARSLEEWQTAYNSALQVMKIGKAARPKNAVYLLDDYQLPVLLAPLHGTWQGEQLSQMTATLVEHDKSGQLIATLEAYFDANGSANDTASKLFIHRNTLKYRLDKITEITGFETTDFSHMAQLYLAIQLGKLS